MSEKNPFGASEVAILFLSMAMETALKRAMRDIHGKTDEEILLLIPDEEARKKLLMSRVRQH
jgi:hypothetical protein